MDYLRKFPSYSKDSNFNLYNGNLEESKFDYFKQKFPTHYEIESSLKSSQDAFVSWNNNFNIHSFHYPNYNRLYSQPRIADVSSQIIRPLVSTFPPTSVFQENPHSFTGNSIFHHVFPTHQQPQQGHQLHFNHNDHENQQKMAFHTMKRPRSEKKPVPELMKDEKYKEKRAKNNKAAKKSRQERREKEDKNEKELKLLREELRRLVEEEWTLKVQNHELKTKIAAMSKQLCLDGDLNGSTSGIS